MNGLPESQMLGDAQSVDQSIGIEKKENNIPYGYCQCGCKKKTSIAKYSDKRNGQTKGHPVRFVRGHHARLQPKGKDAYRWKGGRSKLNDGRVLIFNPKHPRVNHKYILNSILLAEKALGKRLPPGIEVHHFDEDPSNDFKNLVICENVSYHRLLHRKKKASDACGNANWRKCYLCQKHDDPKNLKFTKKDLPYHKTCYRIYKKNLYHKNKNEVQISIRR